MNATAKIKKHLAVQFISDESEFGDGVFVYLKPGYHSLQETHCIHEDTIEECLTELKYVQWGPCEDCIQDIIDARHRAAALDGGKK